MLHFLRSLLPHTDDISSIVHAHPLILDVRTQSEYRCGHIEGSLNIPLDALSDSLAQISDKSKPIVVCCASGSRSGAAKALLLSEGYLQVYNGGGWRELLEKLHTT